jgi:AcrR family transcriptional regulator
MIPRVLTIRISGGLSARAVTHANHPRRKAKQERSRATVDAVLEAAARVLAERGYAAATTTRLADTAGVSIGTLYEYFANREEVFDALIRRELDALVVIVRSQDLDPGLSLIDKFVRLIGAAMASMRYGPELFRSLEQVPGAVFRRHLSEARSQVTRFIEDLLEDHRSELRVTDTRLAAFVAVSAVEGVAANVSNDRFDARLAREIEDLLRSYLTGVDERQLRG